MNEEKKFDDNDYMKQQGIPKGIKTRTDIYSHQKSSSASLTVVNNVKVVNKEENKDSTASVSTSTQTPSPTEDLDYVTSNNAIPPEHAMSASPLPFDDFENCDFEGEDPISLLKVPANILSLPISPCGPNDDFP